MLKCVTQSGPFPDPIAPKKSPFLEGAKIQKKEIFAIPVYSID
jgi:hypothetical protein